jgi:hypothetical protein
MLQNYKMLLKKRTFATMTTTRQHKPPASTKFPGCFKKSLGITFRKMVPI